MISSNPSTTPLVPPVLSLHSEPSMLTSTPTHLHMNTEAPSPSTSIDIFGPGTSPSELNKLTPSEPPQPGLTFSPSRSVAISNGRCLWIFGLNISGYHIGCHPKVDGGNGIVQCQTRAKGLGRPPTIRPQASSSHCEQVSVDRKAGHAAAHHRKLRNPTTRCWKHLLNVSDIPVV